ncbi:hypothetical protein Tco_0894822 [Tanacetum coccineum]|uniref:Reverse transcriptase domain-containing protein n=1 Tax=Tanacetum coccineum TaxID=301880 RepID=A0ABQ5CCV6_9ASTR
MVAVGGNFMRKTPQEAYDLIKNITQHHFQWDAELYYNTTTDMSAYYSETIFVRENELSDDDEPAEMIEEQKSIHHLSGSPTPSSDPMVASLSHSLTPTGDSDSILEETDTLLPHHDSTLPEVDDDIFDPVGDILFLEGLLNEEISSDLPPLELNNDPEGDVLFLEKLLKDEPLEANKSEINPLIREPSNTFLMGDEEIKLNSHEDINDLVPIPKVSEKPLDSLDCISKTFDMTIIDPLFDFKSEFTLNSNNPVFGIHNEEIDESETEIIMDEVQNHSPQSTAQIPPSLDPFVEIPSGESKVHIEILSVLWGNMLPIPEGSLPLSRTPDVAAFKKVKEITEVEIRLLALVG